MVDSVVDDVLTEIFLRLPVKTLIRFKSVSKHWQSLISDPGFSILRNPNPNPATGLILQVPIELQPRPESDPGSASDSAPYAYIVSFNDDTSSLKLINPYRPRATMIRSSCNGLLLCGSYSNRKCHSTRYVVRYYVCNPTTNTYFKLPQIPDDDEPDYRMLLPMCLAFDPSKPPHYKVVCALRSLESEDTETFQNKFMVYSSETGCWRKSCVEPFQAANVDFQRGVYWKGALHWVSLTNTGKSIYFDPDDDRMSQEIMPTPPILDDHDSPPCIISYYFGESCGHLHYVDNCWMAMTELVVYELKKDYSEWFVKYRIHDSCHTIVDIPYLFAVVRGKSHEDSFAVFLKKGKFVRYNFLHETRETMFEVHEDALPHQCFKNVPVHLPVQHVEYLCSV